MFRIASFTTAALAAFVMTTMTSSAWAQGEGMDRSPGRFGIGVLRDMNGDIIGKVVSIIGQNSPIVTILLDVSGQTVSARVSGGLFNNNGELVTAEGFISGASGKVYFDDPGCTGATWMLPKRVNESFFFDDNPDQVKVEAIHHRMNLIHEAKAVIEQNLNKLDLDPSSFVEQFLAKFYGDATVRELVEVTE